MKCILPDFMLKHLPTNTNFYLISGIYSSIARTQFGQTEAPITKIGIRFRSLPGQEFRFNGLEEMPVGSMDPGAFNTSDNRLVLGIIETAKGELYAATMWIPDGTGGQYTVEQTYFWLANWLVSKAEHRRQIGQIICGVIMAMIPLIGGLLFKKCFIEKIKEEDRTYGRLDLITTPRLMRDFGHWLMEGDYFSRAFEIANTGHETITTGRL